MERTTIRVTNRLLLKRGTELDAELRPAFEHANPAYKPKAARRFAQYAEPPTLRTWRLDGDYLSLPRGGTGRVRAAARKLGVELAWQDERVDGLPELAGRIPDHLFTFRGYQREMSDVAVRRQNALLEAGTGSGKTCVAFGTAARLKLATLVIVWTGNLLDQWIERCEKELGIDPSDVGLVRGPDRRIAPITIAMQQTLAAHPEWVAEHAKDFGLVIADEIQRAAAPTVYAAVDPWWSRYRIGITADHTRKDGKDVLIRDLLGDVAVSISEERLVAEGAVLPVSVRVVPTEFRADWFVRTARNRKPTDQNKLLEQMCGDAARNEIAVGIAHDEAARGESVLVWSARVEHCHLVDAALARLGVMSGLLLGGTKYAARFEETRRGLAAGRLRAGVGTIQAVGTGTDLPVLSRGVLTLPLHTNRQMFNQAKGRLCRPGTRDATLYYLWDRHVYGRRPVENLVKWFGDRVEVLSGQDWVAGRHYLRGLAADRGVDPGDDLEGMFVR